MKKEIPVFPLHTVLFPGGELPLRIFELRYRRLVDVCGKNHPFLVVNIRHGREVGEPAFTHTVGTTAMFDQVQSQRDGSLAALVYGEQRVRLSELRVEADGLMFAQISALPAEHYVRIPDDLMPLAQTLEESGAAIPDAGMLAWRLADGLPLSAEVRQTILEENDAEKRLALVRVWLLRHPNWFSV